MTTQFTVRNTAVATFILAAGMATVVAQSTPQKLLVGDTKVEMISSYNGPKLNKPDRIVVYGFNEAPEIITMDDSAAGRLQGRGMLGRLNGETPDTTPQIAAEHVNAVFTKTLLNELGKSAIPAERAVAGEEAMPAKTLIVKGNFTIVNEGNKSKRVMIGFGRGASDVRAHVTVSMMTEKGRIVLSEFNLDSKSGKKPGAIMGMGSAAAGVAASVAAGSVGDKKETVEGDASRMAKAVAKQIEAAMTSQQWIAAPEAQIKQVGAM